MKKTKKFYDWLNATIFYKNFLIQETSNAEKRAILHNTYSVKNKNRFSYQKNRHHASMGY